MRKISQIKLAISQLLGGRRPKYTVLYRIVLHRAMYTVTMELDVAWVHSWVGLGHKITNFWVGLGRIVLG